MRKKIIILIFILITDNVFASQIIQCGGGLTDKYGITWSPTGRYIEPDGLSFKESLAMMEKYCPQTPSISPESCTCALNTNPPKGTPVQEINYWLHVRNKDYPKYTGKCSKEMCTEISK